MTVRDIEGIISIAQHLHAELMCVRMPARRTMQPKVVSSHSLGLMRSISSWALGFHSLRGQNLAFPEDVSFALLHSANLCLGSPHMYSARHAPRRGTS